MKCKEIPVYHQKNNYDISTYKKMEQCQTKCNIKSSMLLIVLCWLIYTCSYIGKLNYAASINQVMVFYKVSHAEAGLVSTFFFFAYGVGQVVNG